MSFRGRRRLALHRPVDFVASAVGLVVLSPVLLVTWAAAALSSGGSGFFRQARVGRHAKVFTVVKLRTMYADSSGSDVATSTDERITRVGAVLRRTKLDELPQLINVVKGEMALLGPRPDVPGFADRLIGDDRLLLELRPGVSGPASVAFSDEEIRLAEVADPVRFNIEVLYPLKTRINSAWYEHGTLVDDCRLVLWSIKAPDRRQVERLLISWDEGLLDDPGYCAYSSAEG